MDDRAQSAPQSVLSFEGKTLPDVIPFEYDGETTVSVEGLAREVALSYEKDGVTVVKTLSFAPDTYLTSGKYEIRNKSRKTVEYAAYFVQRGEIEQTKYGPADALVRFAGRR